MTGKFFHLKMVLIVFVLFTLFFPEIGLCNQYRELSLAEKVDQSDLVLIVTVTSITSNKCFKLNSCASLKVQSTLKGDAPTDIQILFDGQIAEEAPLCCTVGSTYVAFLKKVEGKYYESTNGPYGIYSVHVDETKHGAGS